MIDYCSGPVLRFFISITLTFHPELSNLCQVFLIQLLRPTPLTKAEKNTKGKKKKLL